LAKLKNVQVIDGAVNSTFDIYAVPDEVFTFIFPEAHNVAFLKDTERRLSEYQIDEVQFWQQFYKNRVFKPQVRGIHGTLHLTGSLVQERYFPTRREEDVIRDT
jgi:hypothetical protein